MLKILDFYADWCVPCKQLNPILEELKDQVLIQKVNVETEDDLVSEYGIKNIPTLLFLKDNVVVDKIIGKVPKNQILNKIEKWN